jgi:hypothetical protein
MYRHLGRYISISGFDYIYFINILIMDGIDVSTFDIMSMSISQPSTSMALSRVDNDTINDVSMVDP